MLYLNFRYDTDSGVKKLEGFISPGTMFETMDTIRRFIILFSIFFISALVLVIAYATYFPQNGFEILTPTGVIIVLLLILLCNLLPKRSKNDFSNPDRL